MRGEARAAYAAVAARMLDNPEKNMVSGPAPAVQITLDASSGEEVPEFKFVDIDICAVKDGLASRMRQCQPACRN